MANKKKSIKKPNYLINILIVFGLCVLLIYSYNAFINYQKELNKNSYLSRTIKEIQYEELDKVFTEATDNYFIYISYIDKDKILDLEKDLKKIILKYNIEDNMYFLNVNELYTEETFYKDLNTKLGLKDNKITNVPSIVYYKDDKIMEVLTSTEDKLIEASEFENLLKIYEINEEE